MDSMKRKNLIAVPKTKTQRAALEILNKEEINAKRSRLESLLLQQFQGKYGTSNPSNINESIRVTVKSFLDSFDNIISAEAMVGELETNIRNTTAKIKEEQRRKKANQQIEEQQLKQLEMEKSNSRMSMSAGNNKGMDSPQNIQGNQWPVINAILAVSDEQQNQKKAREAAEKKLKFQEELRKQIEANKSRLVEEQLEKQITLERNKALLANIEAEKQHEQLKKELNFKMERSLRLGQIQERKELKELERQQRIAIEQAEMARARRLAMEEEASKQQRKEEQKRQQDLLFAENEKNKAAKNEASLKRQEQEKQLNREYEAKLEREELARQQAFQARLDVLAQSAKKYEMKVGSKLQEQENERLQSELQMMKEKDKMDFEKEKYKVDKRKNDLLESTQYNQSMVERKRQEKERERLDALERKLKMERDAEEMKRKEKDQLEKKKLKMIELKMTLDEQVTRKHSSDHQGSSLSETERMLNMSIIKKLNDDPKLLAKVAEKVNPAPQRVLSSRSSGNNIF